jgi:hypothetical protein
MGADWCLARQSRKQERRVACRRPELAPKQQIGIRENRRWGYDGIQGTGIAYDGPGNSILDAAAKLQELALTEYSNRPSPKPRGPVGSLGYCRFGPVRLGHHYPFESLPAC